MDDRSPRGPLRRIRVRAAATGLALAGCLALAACSVSGNAATAPSTGPTPGLASGLGPVTVATSPSAGAALPPDLGPAAPARCTPDLARGWLARENARRGGAVQVRATGTDASEHLYLDTVSAVCGTRVGVAVSAWPSRYRLRVVRVGWYRGAGGRVVQLGPTFTAGPQQDPPGTDRARSPRWRVTQTLTVGQGWAPGFYLVQLMAGDRALSSAPLVVLAPPTARRSPLLFVASAMTWTAYTDFGGRSLYRNTSLTGDPAYLDRARTADVARPTEGPGVYTLYRYTTPLVRAVERTGLDVDYAADLDVDRFPSLLRGRTEIVTGTHTEYVTQRVYSAFGAARDAGTNLAFLGGNAFYWQARVQRDAAGRPVSVTVYRKASEDPLLASSPDLATVRWRDPPVLRPEASLLGAQYDGLGLVAPLVVLDPPAWLGWTRGQILPAGVGGEVDAVTPGASPPRTQVIAAGAGTVKGKEITSTVSYYAAASGAGVFDASSLFVGCATTDTCETVRPPAATRVFWLRAIARVVSAFAAPRFGATHPPDPAGGTVPSYSWLVHTYGPAAGGRSIKDGD